MTTGRSRRTGWFDAVIARYAVRVNGLTDLFLTKLDVLSGFDEVPICVGYEVDGERLDEMPMTQTDFHHAKPIYETLPGWDEDISARPGRSTTCPPRPGPTSSASRSSPARRSPRSASVPAGTRRSSCARCS